MNILNTNSHPKLNLKMFCNEAFAYANGKLKKQGKKVLKMCVTKEMLFKECVDNFKSNAKRGLKDASNR